MPLSNTGIVEVGTNALEAYMGEVVLGTLSPRQLGTPILLFVPTI